MAIATLPTYTLPASKFLASITTFINQLRFKDTLHSTDLVNTFVDSCRVGKVDTGKGIVFTFKKALQPVNDYSETSSVLSITKPSAVQEIIAIDTYKFIPISISYQLMADAVPQGALVDTFVSYLYSLLEDTMQFHLFDVLVAELLAWTPVQATQTLTIDLISETGLSGADLEAVKKMNANKIAKEIRLLLNNLQYKSTAYTDVSTTTTAVNKDQLRLIMNDEFETNFLADSMASLFHDEKVGEMLEGPSKIVLPKVNFALAPTTIGYLFDKEKLALADYYKLTMSFTDASNLFTNTFLHFAYGKGVFANAIGIKIVANYQ